MHMTFTKGTGKYDRLEIVRPAGKPEHIECPKQGIIPHEMVHFAVEHTLQARGFLHRIKEGEAARFRMTAEDQTDGVERLVEVIQADQWSGGGAAPAEILDLYRTTCSARNCSVLPVDAEAILAIRGEVERLGARWSSVPVGGSLHLEL